VFAFLGLFWRLDRKTDLKIEFPAIPLKAPRGGHRRLPNFGKAFGALYASVVCTGGCTDRWRLRVGYLRLGDFAFLERP